jgi:hypothetical protein
VAHHQTNWTNCPKSLSGHIDKITQQIKPPLSTPELKRDIDAASNDFKSRITSIVQQHLEDSAYGIMRRATDVNPLDIDRAQEVANRQLNRRLGKRMHRTPVSDAMNEIATMIKKPKIPPTRRVNRPEDQDWSTVVRKSHREHTTVVPSTGSLPTSNRFNALGAEAETRPTSDATTLKTPPLSQRRRLPQPPTNSTVGHRRSSSPPHGTRDDTSNTPLPPPLLTPYGPSIAPVGPPLASAANPLTSRLQPTLPGETLFDSNSDNDLCEILDHFIQKKPHHPPKPDIRIHAPTPKTEWNISPLKSGMSTLIITDSNGLSMAHADLSDGWTLEVFRGARLSHVTPLLKGMDPSNFSTMVLAVGLNDRLSDPSDVVSNLNDIKTWARENNKRFIFTSIPVIPSLPDATKEVVKRFNETAADLVEDFLEVISEPEIQLIDNDTSGIHFNQRTASIIIGRIADFLVRQA